MMNEFASRMINPNHIFFKKGLRISTNIKANKIICHPIFSVVSINVMWKYLRKFKYFYKVIQTLFL